MMGYSRQELRRVCEQCPRCNGKGMYLDGATGTTKPCELCHNFRDALQGYKLNFSEIAVDEAWEENR